MNEELNKELCELLGICWHSLSRYAAIDDDDGNGCVCGKCERSFPLMNSYDPLQGNPDFTSDSGKVQLLKLIVNNTKMLFDTDQGKIIDWILDDTGAFAIAARDFLRKEKN